MWTLPYRSTKTLWPVFTVGNHDLLKPPKDLIDVTVGAGRWQILVTLTLSFIEFIHLLNTGNETLLRPTSWWCKKPKFLDDWTDVQWILYSHHRDSCVGICESRVWSPEMLVDGYFQGCQVYDSNYEALKGLRYAKRPMIEANRTIPCPYGIDYSTKSGRSLVEKHQKACSNGTVISSSWLSSSTLGRITGYVVFGTLSDWIGRKSVIFLACGATPITALFVAVSTNYTMFLVASILHGFFHGGFAVCMVLVLEISTNAWRTALMAISCGSFALGIGLTPIINGVFDSYDQMIVFINLLCVVMFVSTRFLPESPAWLFCTRDSKGLEKMIRKAADVNQRQLSLKFRVAHVDSDDERRRLPKQMPRIWNLMLQPDVACQLFGIIYLIGLFGTIFGGSYHAILSNIAKSQLANTLLAASTMIGVLIGQLCTLLMGHGRILRVSISLVLLSSFLLMIRLHDLQPSIVGPTTTLLLLDVSMISLAHGVLLNYNTRAFPTLLRGTLSGIFRSTWAIFVWTSNHNYVTFPRRTITLIICCVIAALFSLNLREVTRRELPDTVEDCIHFKGQPKPKRWEIAEIIDDSLVDETSYVSVEKPSESLDSVGRIVINDSGKRNLWRIRRRSQRIA